MILISNYVALWLVEFSLKMTHIRRGGVHSINTIPFGSLYIVQAHCDSLEPGEGFCQHTRTYEAYQMPGKRVFQMPGKGAYQMPGKGAYLLPGKGAYQLPGKAAYQLPGKAAYPRKNCIQDREGVSSCGAGRAGGRPRRTSRETSGGSRSEASI